MLALSLFALLRMRGVPAHFSRHVSPFHLELPGFVHLQVEEFFRHLHSAAKHTEPHARQLRVVIIGVVTRGHDYFIERIFGRIVRERGKASSFFLKHIAEHKEGLNKNSDLAKK